MKAQLKAKIKEALQGWTPPVVRQGIRKKRVRFRGDYLSFDEAKKELQESGAGYADQLILNLVDKACQKVIQGQAAYERDSVAMEKLEYSWPVLAALMWTAARHGALRVCDFGGGLGSTVRQYSKFLKTIPYQWVVVEQDHFVKLGQEKYQTDSLHFFKSLDEAIHATQPNLFFISSTLQYLENPMEFLKTVKSKNFPILVFDRTSIIDGDKNRLTIQEVHPAIYKGSYPCWFFSEKRLLEILSDEYECIEKFESYEPNVTYIDGKIRSTDYGYIFVRRSLA